MEFSTTRFGKIMIDESRIITMKGGLLGFDHLKQYVLLTQNEKIPFWWFQSINDGATAFVVINSFMVHAGYEPIIADNDVRLLEISSSDDVLLLSVVTISSDPVKITANLRAPIVINVKQRLAKQIVLQDQDYPIQCVLTNMEGIAVDAEKTRCSDQQDASALISALAGS